MEPIAKIMRDEMEAEPNVELHPQLADRMTKEQFAHLQRQVKAHLAEEEEQRRTSALPDQDTQLAEALAGDTFPSTAPKHRKGVKTRSAPTLDT